MFFCHQVNFLPVPRYLVKHWSTTAQSLAGSLKSCHVLVQGRCLLFKRSFRLEDLIYDLLVAIDRFKLVCLPKMYIL